MILVSTKWATRKLQYPSVEFTYEGHFLEEASQNCLTESFQWIFLFFTYLVFFSSLFQQIYLSMSWNGLIFFWVKLNCSEPIPTISLSQNLSSIPSVPRSPRRPAFTHFIVSNFWKRRSVAHEEKGRNSIVLSIESEPNFFFLSCCSISDSVSLLRYNKKGLMYDSQSQWSSFFFCSRSVCCSLRNTNSIHGHHGKKIKPHFCYIVCAAAFDEAC